MAPKRQPSKQGQPPPPPSRQAPLTADLLHAVLANPLVVEAIFDSLPSIQDRVALASISAALRAHAYVAVPSGSGGGSGGGGAGGARPRLWPSLHLTDRSDPGVFDNKISWLVDPRRCRGAGARAVTKVAPVLQRLFIDIVEEDVGESDNALKIPALLAACSALVSADVRLAVPWLAPDGAVPRTIPAASFPATLRHLRLDVFPSVLEEEEDEAAQEVDLAPLTALTSLQTRWTALASLPPSLRRLECCMWTETETSESEAFVQPEALEFLRIGDGGNDEVWVAGGQGGGAASGDGLTKFLKHAKYVEIEALVPLDAQFFALLSPTLHTLRLANLFNGPGLAGALECLAAQAPGLRRVALSPGRSHDGPQELVSDDFAWSDSDCVEVALAALSIPKLEHLGLAEFLDVLIPAELSEAQRARFAALPVLADLRTLEISKRGFMAAAELLVDKIPGVKTIYITGSVHKMDALRPTLAAAVPALPALAAINWYGEAPLEPVQYIWGLSPGSPEWEAASPELKAAFESATERGFKIDNILNWSFQEMRLDFPPWDAFEVAEHGPGRPCVDLDSLGNAKRQAWRAENYGPQA